MRQAARHIEIYREQTLDTIAYLFMSAIEPARYGACSRRDDQSRLADGLVRHQQGIAHIPRDRAGHEDAVGVSRGGDELDAEPAGIEDDIAQRVGLDLAAVAAPSADLAQPQRAAEQPLQLAVERGDFRHRVAGGDKRAAPRGGQPPIARERNAAPRAPRFAVVAE